MPRMSTRLFSYLALVRRAKYVVNIFIPQAWWNSLQQRLEFIFSGVQSLSGIVRHHRENFPRNAGSPQCSLLVILTIFLKHTVMWHMVIILLNILLEDAD